MKEKLNRAKTWYLKKLDDAPLETLAASLTMITGVVGLYNKVGDAKTNRLKAKAWKQEVERRERKDRSCRH